MTTVAERLKAVDGRPSGFDYLRLSLALGVIFYHTIVTSYGGDVQTAIVRSFWRPVVYTLLPMFFALSGFLVAGSLERSKTLLSFLCLRIIRIFPALAGETILSALILGPLLTSVPLHVYFTSHEFHTYFFNVIGDIHYDLPGVIKNNPWPLAVNGQLWTVPFELRCYGLLAAIALLGIFRNRKWLLVGLIALYDFQPYYIFHHLSDDDPYMTGNIMVMTFIGGVFLYRFKDVVPLRADLFAACIVISALLMEWFPFGDRFISLPMAYITVYVGLKNPRRNAVLLSGDYSYALFLYGFVIQQSLMSLGPKVQHWYINLALAVPATLFVAVCSWWFIEKPALNAKPYIKLGEEHYLRARNAVLLMVTQKLLPKIKLFQKSGQRAIERIQNQDERA